MGRVQEVHTHANNGPVTAKGWRSRQDARLYVSIGSQKQGQAHDIE